MRFFLCNVIFFFFLIYSIYRIIKGQRPVLHRSVDPRLDLVFFDNGIGSFWFAGPEKPKALILCFRGLKSFQEDECNAREIEKLWPHYQIVYIEYPGFGVSSDCQLYDYETFMNELYLVYKCVLRYEPWQKVGFMGFGYGAIIQSEIFARLEKGHERIPDWIVQINGFSSFESIILFRVPWILQLFVKNKEIDSAINYKNITIPLLIFHSRNNTIVPLLDSIKLHLALRDKSTFISLYGDKEFTLLSKENQRIIRRAMESFF